MGTTIRDARLDDVPHLLLMLEKFAAFYETKLSLFPEPEQAVAIMCDLVTSHVVLVAEKDGVLVGLIAGFGIKHPLNPAIKTLAECFWWVEHEHRSSIVGGRLLAEFINRGKIGYRWVTLSLIDGHSPIRVETLKRLGFVQKETAFLMEVE